MSSERTRTCWYACAETGEDGKRCGYPVNTKVVTGTCVEEQRVSVKCDKCGVEGGRVYVEGSDSW